MLLAHARTLAQARSHLAALADTALSIDAASAFEHTLIQLDRIHGDDCPTTEVDAASEDRALLHAIATSALEELELYGIDPLSVELTIAMLDDAYDLDVD